MMPKMMGVNPSREPVVLCTGFIPVSVSRSNWLEIREKWQNFPKMVKVLMTMTRKQEKKGEVKTLLQLSPL